MRPVMLVLVLLAGCALAATPLLLTVDHNGKKVEMTVGQTAELSLEMAGGTGYTWVLNKIDEAVLKVGEKRVDVQSPGMPGGPVTMIWPLTAVGKGEIKLVAQLVRPWMPDKPAKVITIEFSVK